MIIRHRAAIAAIVFTILVLVAVNIGWWLYYHSITTYLEEQLSLRLKGAAGSAALYVNPDILDRLAVDDLDAYLNLVEYLDSLASIDSLSEAAILDLDFNYLASTREDTLESGYLLAVPDFDSLQRAVSGFASTSVLYNVDGTYLKSAYAPIYDSAGNVGAIALAEAGVSYFTMLDTLRGNLIFMAGGSAGAVIILLVFYIIYNRRLAAAEQKLFESSSQAALGRMVAVVSHEVKNPLMIINAAGERLQSKYNDAEAGFITEEVERLNQIVTGYLDFARGTEKLHLEKFDLAELIRKILNRYGDRLTASGIRLETSIPDEGPEIKADRIALRQVIVNLLLNAAEAVESANLNGGRGLVRLEIKGNDDGHIKLYISDNGVGISRADRKRLFEPFYTTKTAGSGLGLYLSRRIIENHGGTVRLADYESMTVFEISLPKDN